MDSAVLLDLLGNENRRRILRLLSHKPCYVTEIGEYLGVSPKAVIDHLRKLEEAGLVESHTDERRRKYFHIARDVRLEVNVSRHGFGTKSAYPANPSLDIRQRCPHMRIDLDLPTGSAGDGTADGDGDGSPGDGGPDGDGEGTGRGGDGRDDGEAVGTGKDGEDTGTDDDSDGDGDGDREGGSRGGVATLAAEFDRLRDLESELSLAQRWVHGRMAETLDRLNDRLGVDADSRFFAELLAAVASTDGDVRSVAEEVNESPEAVGEGLRRLADADLLVRDDDRWTLP